MALLNSIADIKRFVGGGANTALKFESIEPVIHDAARDHLVPHLGSAFFQLLNGSTVTQYDADDPLRDYIRRALARLTMYEYIKIGSVQVSEVGITTRTTDSETVAYRYLQKQYADDMLVKGYEAIEEMLIFLMTNRNSYPHWASSEGASRHTELFVRYAMQMRLHYGMDVSRYSYEILRGILRDVEYFAIDALLPRKFVARLRLINETAAATEMEREVLMMVQAIITHFAIEEGIRRFWVQFNGRSVVHTEATGDQGAKTERTATGDGVKMKIRHHDLWANRHVSRLQAFLWENKTDFPLCFGVSENGTNTDADAWKLPTTEETSADLVKLAERKIILF